MQLTLHLLCEKMWFPWKLALICKLGSVPYILILCGSTSKPLGHSVFIFNVPSTRKRERGRGREREREGGERERERERAGGFLIAYLHLPWQEGYRWFQVRGREGEREREGKRGGRKGERERERGRRESERA